MTDVIKSLRDYLSKSPSVVYPQDVLEYLPSIEAENAKLRELVAILCHCMQIKASCDDCRISGHKGELARDPLCACDGLHEMLRELSVEVDE